MTTFKQFITGQAAVAPPSDQADGELPERPEPWDDAEGQPISGQVGVMPAEISPDTATIQPNPVEVLRLQAPKRTSVIPEGTDVWQSRSYDVKVGETKMICARNNNRVAVYISVTPDFVRLAPTEQAAPFGAQYGPVGFDGWPFTSEVWAQAYSTDVTVSVIELYGPSE